MKAEEEKTRHTVTLSDWQIAQLERIVEEQIGILKRDGLGQHPLARSFEELLTVLRASRDYPREPNRVSLPEYKRLEECTKHPAPPTQAVLEGAALLRDLRRSAN